MKTVYQYSFIFLTALIAIDYFLVEIDNVFILILSAFLSLMYIVFPPETKESDLYIRKTNSNVFEIEKMKLQIKRMELLHKLQPTPEEKD